MGNDIFQDLGHWFIRSPLASFASTCALAASVRSIALPAPNSTVICFHSRSLVLAAQWLGVSLDAAILTLVWRILQWSRTATERFMTLGTILSASALFTALPMLLHHRGSSQFVFTETAGFDSLYLFSIFGQSIALLFIASAFFTNYSSPLTASAMITFLCGVAAVWRKWHMLTTYEQLSKSRLLLSTLAMALSYMAVWVRHDIRHVGLTRSFSTFLIFALLTVMATYSIFVSSASELHPIDKIIYATRTEADRWLVQHAKVSESLKIAAREYRERHGGRDPPPNFDVWYDYATDRKSIIIDHFQQIDEDLRPFWGLDPSYIKEEVAKLKGKRGISTIHIRNGKIETPVEEEAQLGTAIKDFAALIQPFIQHLPDMELPINVLDHPRVLSPWSTETQIFKDKDQDDEDFIASWDHQKQLGQACPSHSAARMGYYPQTGSFCSSCVNPQSESQFLVDRTLGWDLCHQPDLFNLHGFFATHRAVRPFSDLVPVFSRTKTVQHKDILIPLQAASDYYDRNAADTSGEAEDTPWVDKASQLFWRGGVQSAYPLPRGFLSSGHQERLSYLANNASKHKTLSAAVLLSIGYINPDGIIVDENWYRYDQVSLATLNDVLKMDAGISDYSACTSDGCDEIRKRFGIKDEDADGVAAAQSRFVMLTDRDDGPPRNLLQLLRSNSMPIISSIFKQWYSERVFPWLHYVPVDIRLHDLYSTLVYFMGLEDYDRINGRKVIMKPRGADAQWITEQGKSWVERAVRREDAEIYTFRLLLEWGRLIDERRDELGYGDPK
ncbi:hypothetical protein BD289DRAFT_363360 [Coniella lustricola]|uniref:Glycosyl transferase CAP10 domain-containing protein n=1 Tax=Coniella lustricola TaxID=2025994 RepID=A0A2T3AFD5_9PEZI|nr:hypothetical protein BD289DRAFT_363360 [Coniella lustricola]